jgi:F420-dependent oxidoreductase-like protein
MRLSIVLPPETRSLARLGELLERAERLGFVGAMLGTGYHMDPLTAFAALGGRTARLLLTPAIVPSYTRHPIVLAMQALTAQAACGGRLRLGIGPGHASVIEQGYGLRFERLIAHTRDYFAALRALLTGGGAKFEGRTMRFDWALDVEAPPVPLFLSALGEQMCRTAGACADGLLPWLAPPAYVAATIVPELRAGAQRAGRGAPPVAMIMPCIHSTRRDEVRAGVHAYLDRYPRFAAYAALLQRAGVPDAEHALERGWTDPMIDAVVPHGDAAALARRFRAYFDAGVEELALLPVGVGPDPQASVDRTWEVLAEIAREA